MRAVFFLPRFRWCNEIKSLFLRLFGARVGRRVVYYARVWIGPANRLTVGDDVDFALDVHVNASGGIEIGARTLIGYRTQILSANHVIPPARGRIFGSGHERKPVRIGADAWIGANVLILPGVTVGEGAVVAGGSVVTRDVEPYSIVAGNPARFIRYRE